MRDRRHLAAQGPVALDDLGEARRQFLDQPAGVLLHDVARQRFAHFPIHGRRPEARPHRVALDLDADLNVGEDELLDWNIPIVH